MSNAQGFEALARLRSIDAEQAVIGAVMLKQDMYGVLLDSGLQAEHFFSADHRLIWEAVVTNADAGQPADPLTLSETLTRTNTLERIGGPGYLVELAKNTPSSENAGAYAAIVVRKAHERHWYQKLQEAVGMFQDPREADPVGKAEHIVMQLEGVTASSDLVTLKAALGDYIKLKEEQWNDPGLRGLQMGYHNIDHRINGLQPGNLLVVGARPGMGKTNYLLNIVRQVALQKHDYQILVFSLEMNNSELVQRLIGAQGRVKGGLLKSAEVFGHPDSVQRMSVAMGQLKDLNVKLCDAASLTVGELCAMARSAHRRQPVGLVMIDYLGLLDSDGRSDTQALRIADITRALKRLAKELGCPVGIAAQLSRKVEERRDKRPVLADLRDSGAIEQDADIVQFLYRDEYYHEDTNYPGQVEVITAKLRDGEVGTDYLGWEGQYYRMVSQSTKDGEGESVAGYSYDG
ncbi:MAG: replicative DNA helicase [Candidatus Reddybacter sp.]